ncbi:2TM domain-containing protein [Synechococcus sp. UW140]|uniref:2TM domain-containing protein n=1 Tax=Synechococcus sp. UW140 TaxID=368503 RepID=UPI001FCB281F|nr:2TM domain-containing protein [Synechococcus sp. UW140]
MPTSAMDATEQLRAEALASLKRKRAFHKQLKAYLLVSLTLMLVWWADGMGDFWPIWPIAGWGLALIIQGWTLSHTEQPITDREIETEMERMRAEP